MASLINSAFAIETFLEGTRTDEADLAEKMTRGDSFIASDEGWSGMPLHRDVEGTLSAMTLSQPVFEFDSPVRFVVAVLHDYRCV